MPGPLRTRAHRGNRAQRSQRPHLVARKGGQNAKYPRVLALHAVGATLKDVARLADLSYRNAAMWAAEKIESPRCDEAFRKLTGRAA